MCNGPSRLARVAAAFSVASAVVLAGCSSAAKPCGSSAAKKADTNKVQGAVASYDLAVGPPGRFMLGIFNQAKGPVGYGTVKIQFFFLGTSAPSKAKAGPSVTASYLPLPGSPPPPADTSKPVYLSTDQRGVYAGDVAFEQPGIWCARATVSVGGGQTVESPFKVLARHAVPAPGDPAPASQNLTTTTPGAPPAAIDSRASATTPVPDPELHRYTVAQALAEKRPVVLVISTPTYCVSQFCGPITDVVQGLAKDYGDRARFIHIEVWKDYKAQELNDAAKEWIAKGEDINEPWVFVIGADGKIMNRFDNIVTRDAVESVLRKLPPMNG